MKQNVSNRWILFTILSIVLLAVSFMSCVIGTWKEDPSSLSYVNVHSIEKGLLIFTVVPTLFSSFAFLRENKKMKVIASVLLFIQGVTVTFADDIYGFINELSAHVGDRIYSYRISGSGSIAIVLAWILFAVSLGFIFKHRTLFRTKFEKTNPMVFLLSILLTFVSAPVILLYIIFILVFASNVYTVDLYVLVWIVIFTLSFAVLIYMCVRSVKKSEINGSKKYIWTFVEAMLLVLLLQNLFKDKISVAIKDIMFDTYPQFPSDKLI